MHCQYASQLVETGQIFCSLGLYDGQPLARDCSRCLFERHANTNAVPSTDHSLLHKASLLAHSIAPWAINGFKLVDEATLASRLDIFKGCEFWDQAGFAGTGKCKKCGCSTQAKLRMDTSTCPLTPPPKNGMLLSRNRINDHTYHIFHNVVYKRVGKYFLKVAMRLAAR